MSNEITVMSESQVVDYKAKATQWLQNMGTSLPPQQTAQFLELCQAYKLNPFKREIYAVGYGNKFNIITGYEVYLKRAERTGKLDGWTCTTNENNTKAKITIHRKDWQYPFEHEVIMNEVRQNSPIWQKMPTFMMKKVCIEQGMRLCFPDELGGMPYAEEEVSYDRVIQTGGNEAEEAVEEAAVVETNSASENAGNGAKPSESYLRLEQLLDEYGMDLRSKSAKVQPFTLAKQCLDSPESTAEDYDAMYSRCVTFLGHKGIQVA